MFGLTLTGIEPSLYGFSIANAQTTRPHSLVITVFIVYLYYLHPMLTFFQSSGRKTKKKESSKHKTQRATSNVFSMFDQNQIQEFKEVKKRLIFINKTTTCNF